MFLITFFAAIILIATEAVIQNNLHMTSTYRGLKAYKGVASWDRADRICRSEGSYLASPIDEEILKDMKHCMETNHEYNTYFIGTRARHPSGKYVSIEGIALEDIPAFKMVEHLHPENGDCLRINKHGISFVPCLTQLSFICRFNDTMSKNTTHITISDNIMLDDTMLNIAMVNNRIISNTTTLNDTISEITLINNTISEICFLVSFINT